MHHKSLVKLCVVVLTVGGALSSPVNRAAPPEIIALCPHPPGEVPLLLPNPKDCGSFYMCTWDSAVLLTCPPGLEFNANLQVCDYPKPGSCVITTDPPVMTTTAVPVPPSTTTTHVPPSNSTTTTPAPPSNTTTYAPHFNTTTTHAPHSNTTTTTHAPPSNSTTTTPAPPSNTTTYTPHFNTTTTTHVPHSNTTTTTHAPSSNTTSTTSVPFSTPTPTLPPSNKTIPAHSTIPRTRPSTYPSSAPLRRSNIITAPPAIAVQCPSPPLFIATHIPDPSDCSRFYTCRNEGAPVLQHCPPGLLFNADLQVCDFPYNVDCSVTATTAGKVVSTTTTTTAIPNTTIADKVNTTTDVLA